MAVNAESDRPRVHPAVTLTGAGLLATTGLFGFGMLTTSTSGAVSTPASTYAGTGDTVGDTVSDNSAVAGSNGVAFAGTQNTGSDQTANGNSPLATSDETSHSGTFGIGSKTTALSTQATATRWKVLDLLIAFTGQLTSFGQPVSGQTITFTLNGGGRGESCQAITRASGYADCQVVVPLILLWSIHNYTASYAGNTTYAAISAPGTVRVQLGL